MAIPDQDSDPVKSGIVTPLYLAADARLEAPQPDGGVVRAAHHRVLAGSHLRSRSVVVHSSVKFKILYWDMNTKGIRARLNSSELGCSLNSLKFYLLIHLHSLANL